MKPTDLKRYTFVYGTEVVKHDWLGDWVSYDDVLNLFESNEAQPIVEFPTDEVNEFRKANGILERDGLYFNDGARYMFDKLMGAT